MRMDAAGDNAPLPDSNSGSGPSVDRLTIAGLTLLLGPLFAMLHEIVGHAGTCLAVGARPYEIGAYYISCDTTGLFASRLVSAAGFGANMIAALIALILFGKVKSDGARLVAWMAFCANGMTAAGYFLFSGVTGIGDWGPGPDGGMGEMANPMLWRAGLVIIGLPLYIAVTRRAIAMVRAMLGGNDTVRTVQRNMVLTFYFVNGLLALVVGLFNPEGMVIVITSALAATFGGLAGLWNVAYAKPSGAPPRNFTIKRNIIVLVAGIIMTMMFAAIFGPTFYPYGVSEI